MGIVVCGWHVILQKEGAKLDTQAGKKLAKKGKSAQKNWASKSDFISYFSHETAKILQGIYFAKNRQKMAKVSKEHTEVQYHSK